MSTPFDVRRWAEQAGIHTTGGFSVVAECVTLDELQRFADIAIATAAKHWQRAHAITALEALENAQDQLAKPYSTEASKAITALRAALAEQVQEPCGYDETTGLCTRNPCCYTAPPQRKPLTEEEIIAVAKQTDSAEPGRDGYILPVSFTRAIEAAHGIKVEA